MKFRHMQIPAPKFSQEFESLCLDLFRAIWADTHTQLNGRSGQKQHGVDIFGRPPDREGYSGIQCKVKDRGTGAKLTLEEITLEIAKAEHFTPKLNELIFATTAARDASIQARTRQLSETRIADGKFAVSIVAREDIVHYLDNHSDVATKYYAFSAQGYAGKIASQDDEGYIPQVFSSSEHHAKNELSERLSFVIARINEGTETPRITASHVAVAFGFAKLSTAVRLMDGTDEPSLGFLREFSRRFGINFGWLLHGENAPFYQSETEVFSPMEVVPFISKNFPVEVFFVRSQSLRGECTLIFRYGEWDYRTLARAWHVSAEVGGTGTHHLVELYHLILLLRENSSVYCSGQVLKAEEFDRLINGNLFPGAALAKHHRDSDWWYALPDLQHTFPSAPNYLAWYGQSFLDAQNILRTQLLRKS